MLPGKMEEVFALKLATFYIYSTSQKHNVSEAELGDRHAAAEEKEKSQFTPLLTCVYVGCSSAYV